MYYQKTYLNQSANQILQDAHISIMAAGNAEITHPSGYVLVQDQDGDLVITNFDGIVACLICGPRAAHKLQVLLDAREAKQVAVLKADDKRNNTTYASYL